MSVDTLFKLVFAFLVLGKVPVDDLQELLAQIYSGGSVEWGGYKKLLPSFFASSFVLVEAKTSVCVCVHFCRVQLGRQVWLR